MSLSVFLKLEALFCLIMAAPIMLPCAFLGGVVGGLMLQRDQGTLYITLVALLPLVISPIESLWEHPHEEVEVSTRILIEAPAKQVWKEIASVPPIQRSELPASWIYWIGFPRPIAAEIDRPRVGGKRWATFERDVSFFEIVTIWEENKALAFTITADPEFIPHTAFDQHIVIGGRFFDVLDGRYQLEERDGTTTLHLTSRHALSTPFNPYAGWWSRRIMEAIQNSILRVIANRAERRVAND